MSLVNEIYADDFNVIREYCDTFKATAHIHVDPNAYYRVYIMKDGQEVFAKEGNWPSSAARALAEDLYAHIHKGTHTLYKPRNL
jgi:hypothetical protein